MPLICLNITDILLIITDVKIKRDNQNVSKQRKILEKNLPLVKEMYNKFLRGYQPPQ